MSDMAITAAALCFHMTTYGCTEPLFSQCHLWKNTLEKNLSRLWLHKPTNQGSFNLMNKGIKYGSLPLPGPGKQVVLARDDFSKPLGYSLDIDLNLHDFLPFDI